MQTAVTAEGQEQYFLRPEPGHLIELMCKVIEDEQWRMGVRSAGPAHVRTSYTWPVVVDRLLEVLAPD